MSIHQRISTQPREKPIDISRRFRVIGAGFGRTGTTSFAAAMERLLGGPAYHTGIEPLQSDDSLQRWVNMLQPSASPDYIHLTLELELAGYVAVADSVGAAMTPELLETFPDAIVICTVRDPDSWWVSMERLLKMLWPKWFFTLLYLPDWTLRLTFESLQLTRQRFNRHFGLPKETMTNKEFITSHSKWVERIVPPEKLHFVDVRDGWEPLCKILDVPIPNEPFPRLNDAEELAKLMKNLMLRAVKRWLLILGTFGLAVTVTILWAAYK